MLKKIVFMVYLTALLNGVWCFAEDNEFPLLFVPEAQIHIDGAADDWPVTFPFVLESDSQIRSGDRQNFNDFHVTVHCLFDAKNLYLLAEFVDAVPLKNQFQGNDIYRGDSLEVYLGFREEERAAYGAEDFQFGIGLNAQGQQTWVWTKGAQLSGEEMSVLQREKGYVLEARIPLSNFGRASLNAGEAVWIDFGANNDDGGGDRATQMIWHGDGTGWQSPKVWEKGRLFADQTVMKHPRILLPPRFLSEQFHRVYFRHNGKPWQGTVVVGDEQIETDERGGIDFVPAKSGKMVLSVEIDGRSITKLISVKDIMKKRVVKLPVRAIKVNQLGYLPNERKICVVTAEDGAELPSREFVVRPVPGKKEVFRGQLDGPIEDASTGDIVYHGDFSALKTPGKYRIQVEGSGRSYVFFLQEDVFSQAFHPLMRSYYLQRCGMPINDKQRNVSYPACHLEDGVMRQEPEKARDVTGGWHDAGDYGKYMPTAGVTVAQLLLLYELQPEKFQDFSLNLPESSNDLPDMLDEVLYELDWMLKMQDEDGGVFHKVNTQNFPGTILPTDDQAQRYIYEKGTADTGIFAGGIAVAARVLASIDAEYAALLKTSAIRSGNFLLANLAQPPLWPSNDNTGAYKSESADDEVFWGLAELYRLTGELKYLEAIWPLSSTLQAYLAKELPAFGWDNTLSLGLYTLLWAERTPEAVRTEIRQIIFERAEEMSARVHANGYRSSLEIGDFQWASNKTACARGLNLILAYELFGKDEFRQAARAQVDYIFGVNTLSKSFVTGLGKDHVRYPHHRVVEASGVNIPGLLMGGPNNKAEDGVYTQGLQARGYVDDKRSYASNEYAIDYNAPLVFLIGYFMN